MVTQTSLTDQSPGRPRTGRPREGRIDDAVLRATAELLVEQGYADLTLTAIAERAGTTRPALYRRWPSLAHLVHEAAFPAVLTGPFESSGSTTEEIRSMVAGALAAFSDPVARAAAPGLVAAITADPSLHRALLERFASGALVGIEQPLLDVIAGAAFFALLLHPDDLAEEPTRSVWIDRITDLITEGTGT
ncbi:MAG: putative HTH-type transcriptional regulator [Marmoricola sp.]|nr:putative HTH-type transcriptional regulator [Marmoricola sp.]